MEKKYFILDVFAEGDIEASLTNILPHDKMIAEYMERFVEDMSPEEIKEMSDDDIKDEICIWENELNESDCGFMSLVQIFEIDIEKNTMTEYEIPTDEMVQYVKRWAEENE